MNGKIETFEDIQAWQKARELTQKIYRITNEKKFEKDFDLRRQIRKAMVSVTSNIAEGFERNTDKEFSQFLYIAKGSTAEVRSQLYIALDLGYINENDFKDLNTSTVEISKLLSGFIKYLNS